MSTAKERFEALNSSRDQVLSRARDAADITIPALMPPDGTDENVTLPQPYQSLGARGVNNLTSKLRLSLFPPGVPFFRFQIEDDTKALLAGDDPAALTAIESGLQKVENDALSLLESENHGVILHAAIKQLVACGNVLLHMPDEGGSRIFRMPMYCVVRDAMGNWFEMVGKETVSKNTLEEVVRDEAGISLTDTQKNDDEEIDVFTHITRVNGKAEWHQEINDKKITGSIGRSDIKDCPYIPLRWAALEGENYGRGHVEEYIGDLRSLEDLSKALVQMAVAASKVIFLDRPNSTTDIQAIQEAESGDFVEGNVEDVGVLQVEKFHDFQVAKAQVDDLSLRISHAFLLRSGTTRDAERVTAEEIRATAQELEDVLGGVYTVLSQELQAPVVRRLIAQLKKQGKFPKLPKGALKPVIVTGFDALGRGHELNKMRAYFADGVQLFGEAFMGRFNIDSFADILAVAHNINIEPLKKTDEQLASEEQQHMQSALVEQVAGPMAGGMAPEIAKSLAEQTTGQ
jgi:hypothetical protein